MVDEAVVQYIRDARAYGLSVDEIVKNLKDNGWSDEEINEALRQVMYQGIRGTANAPLSPSTPSSRTEREASSPSQPEPSLHDRPTSVASTDSHPRHALSDAAQDSSRTRPSSSVQSSPPREESVFMRDTTPSLRTSPSPPSSSPSFSSVEKSSAVSETASSPSEDHAQPSHPRKTPARFPIPPLLIVIVGIGFIFFLIVSLVILKFLLNIF